VTLASPSTEDNQEKYHSSNALQSLWTSILGSMIKRE